MEIDEIARLTAADLAVEFGPSIIDQTELAIRGELPETEITRDWSVALEAIHTAGDITHTIHFMMIITPIAIAECKKVKDMKVVRAALEVIAKEKSMVKPEIATKVIDIILRKINRKP